MSVVQEPEVKWKPDQMVEVVLSEPDDFLKVRETLTRIGVASRKEKKIYQSCHILQIKFSLAFHESTWDDNKDGSEPTNCKLICFGKTNANENIIIIILLFLYVFHKCTIQQLMQE